MMRKGSLSFLPSFLPSTRKFCRQKWASLKKTKKQRSRFAPTRSRGQHASLETISCLTFNYEACHFYAIFLKKKKTIRTNALGWV